MSQKLTARQKAKFEKLLESFASQQGKDLETMKQEVDYENLYTSEDNYYEGQAVLNFFKARIQPYIEKGEPEANFDKRYREWRFKTCEECGDEFAYAFNYDGVKFCSLLCLDAALQKVGMKVTRGRDLKKRWGCFFHPAVVPSSALSSLKNLYENDVPDAFVDSGKVPPRSQMAPESALHMQDTQA